MVKLKNGTEEMEPLVKVTMLSIESLLSSDPIGFYELVMICRNPKHPAWGDAPAKLARLALLQSNHQPHDSIKNIVLSAVVGDGLDMRLINPVAA